MRFIRYLLQVTIVALGALALGAFAYSPSFRWLPFLGMAGFVGVLLFLTLLLREHTESRLNPSRRLNPKVGAALLALVAVGVCSLSIRIVNGYTGFPSRRVSLLRAAIEVLGPWAVAVFFFLIGLSLLFASYRVLRQS